MAFKREPKMKTTEPSVDEAGSGMKKGGKADGGAMVGALPTAAKLSAARPRGATLLASRAPTRPSAGIPAVKNGGKVAAFKAGGHVQSCCKAEGGSVAMKKGSW